METDTSLTPVDMFRARPFEHALYTIVPLVLSIAQLGNSFVNGLSPLVSVPFAIVLLGFSVVLTRYNFARFRRRALERSIAW
ncbi:hypothetical protein [Halovivax limisalsi]|uniref:hypothetical protein n=1 Tax=Halovivax limisalsi TaxID=1453760 RepID=UPI001FFCE209|nr:hypothetical protein [Halovivax limisalsi]